jgi:hypothetical protein
MTSSKGCLLLAAIALAGCATDQQFLDSKQTMAVDTALQRARFDMNCPEASGTVLSRMLVQPPVGPMGGVYGASRGEYTIGVAGCGQRTTLVVVCPDTSEGCFAADGRR